MPFPENGGEINNYFQCFPLSSSEGDGSADEWKPTQNSEEEEEQVLQRGHKVPKRKTSESLVLQREEESEGDFEEEDKPPFMLRTLLRWNRSV